MRIPTKTVGDGSLVGDRTVATKPAKLFTVLGYNSGPDQFIQIHETAGVPANGVVPKHSFPVAAGQYFAFDLGLVGEDLDAITVCSSTTGASLTASAEQDVSIQAILHA